jgi:transposase
MGKPLKWTVDQKLPLVLSILRGEGSVAEIGRRHQVSDATLAKWRDAFLAGGAAALANGSRRGQPSREADLETELEEVKAALGEAHAELRVWRKKGALYPASRTSS